MRALLFIIFFVISPLVADAGECAQKTPEEFAIFFNRFSADKQFAVSRTLYPLRAQFWEYGVDEKGHDASAPTLTLITKEQDQKEPNVSSYLQQNGLDFEIKRISQKSANVHLFKAGTDLSVLYHFTNKSRCWFLREIEDRSL